MSGWYDRPEKHPSYRFLNRGRGKGRTTLLPTWILVEISVRGRRHAQRTLRPPAQNAALLARYGGRPQCGTMVEWRRLWVIDARARNTTPERRTEITKKAAAKRWARDWPHANFNLTIAGDLSY